MNKRSTAVEVVAALILVVPTLFLLRRPIAERSYMAEPADADQSTGRSSELELQAMQSRAFVDWVIARASTETLPHPANP